MCAGVKRLQKLGMIHSAPGMGALDMNSAEDMVVAHTREVVPGMVICGMEVCSYALSVLPCAPLPSNRHRCKLLCCCRAKEDLMTKQSCSETSAPCFVMCANHRC